MNKRGAGDSWTSGEERYGGSAPGMDIHDKPVQATAAQMARRKIAAAKKPGSVRARSGSPAVGAPHSNVFGGGGGIFGGGGGASQQQPQQQSAGNPFATSNFDFSFGGTPQTNGSSAPAPFQFGSSAPAPSQPQQNGTSNVFGQSAAPSFGTSFGTNASQPQQNGFAPSTSMFNQPSQSSTNTAFNFGQTSSAQQNGTSTPTSGFGGFGSQVQQDNTNGASSLFGGGAQEKLESKTTNAFTGFGQTPATSNEQPSNSFSGFGQSAAQNGDKAQNPFGGLNTPSTQQNGSKPNNGLFAGISQDRSQENGQQGSNPFAGLGQQKTPEPERSGTPFSGFGQKPAETATNAGSLFQNLGQKPLENSNKPLFGASQAQQQTPKPATGMFAGLSNNQPQKPSTSMFNVPPTTEPASSGKGLFGASIMPNESNKGNTTGSIFDNLPPRETPVFGSHIPGQAYTGSADDDDDQQATDSDKTELFPNSKAAIGSQSTPSNLFAGFGSTQATPGSSLFPTSSGQQDTSMTTPSGTPQKPLFAPSETPATQPPRSMFDRINKPAPASSTPATEPPRSLFDRIEQKPDETPKASLFNRTAETPSAAKSLFPQSTSTSAPPPPWSQKPAESSAPVKNLFSQTAAAPSTPAAAPTASAPSFKAPPATAPVGRTYAAPGRSGLSQVSNASSPSEEQKESFRELNGSLLAYLNSKDTGTDWSKMFQFALIASADIAGREPPSDAQLNPTPPSSAISAGSATASSRLFSSAAPKPASSSTAALTQDSDAAQTPKAAAPTSGLFNSNPPATAPTKKRLFEEDSEDSAQQPATEKRSKPSETPSYPKLPNSASATAKLFASTLDKPESAETPKSSSGFNPATKSLFSTSNSASTSATPSNAGFTPNFATQASAPAAPSIGGFTPAAGVAGSSFLSSFGAAAKEQEDKDRKKRKMEEYDSDEETEEQWLKRDQEQQAAKRKKIEDASKGAKGFSLGGPTSAAKPPTAASLENAQGTGDNTWKPETPIKFGAGAAANASSFTPAGAPPKLGGSLFGPPSTFGGTSSKISGGGLFASASTPSTDASGKLAPPSTGFNFSSQPSSLGVSRATTPGVTTDGEASNAAEAGDNDAEGQTEPQAEDQTGLTAEERETHEVLAELHDIKTQMLEIDDSGKKKWMPKGFGVVYLLKDKGSGKTRILSRVGAGKLTLNYNPLKGVTYLVHPKKDNIVMAQFFDHLHASPAALGQFLMTATNANDAKELVRILMEGRPQ